MTIEHNVPLAPLTTFHIGGSARFFVRVSTKEELAQALAYAKERELKVLILGGGSNMLIDDVGFNGLVIKIELMGVTIEHDKNGAIVVAGAGEGWEALVARAVEEKLWGIENLSGIPGTVGAAPVQNIGAYGCEIKDTLEWVEALDTETGGLLRLSREQCLFGYRSSIFKLNPGRLVVLQVALRLLEDGTPRLFYKDLAEVFQDAPAPTLSAVRDAVLNIRAKKFPDLSQEGTAGSFFLNPAVSKEKAAQLLERYPELPQFPAPNGVKLSLAWLLDNALQLRGYSHGSARLFEKQPLVIVASGSNAFSDVVALKDEILQKVFETLEIELEPEVRIIENKK
jgi:UDP-N-acetylmuramate dehydrogenase